MPRAARGDFDGRLRNIVSSHVDGLVGAIAAEVRKAVAEEIKTHFAGTASKVLGVGKRRGAGGAKKVRKILPCIAPGCKNPSKGPRFHYLCDDHRNASKKDYEAWRDKKKGA